MPRVHARAVQGGLAPQVLARHAHQVRWHVKPHGVSTGILHRGPGCWGRRESHGQLVCTGSQATYQFLANEYPAKFDQVLA